jgi:hypothetical protein
MSSKNILVKDLLKLAKEKPTHINNNKLPSEGYEDWVVISCSEENRTEYLSFIAETFRKYEPSPFLYVTLNEDNLTVSVGMAGDSLVFEQGE